MVIPHLLKQSSSFIHLFYPHWLDGHCAHLPKHWVSTGPEADVWTHLLCAELFTNMSSYPSERNKPSFLAPLCLQFGELGTSCVVIVRDHGISLLHKVVGDESISSSWVSQERLHGGARSRPWVRPHPVLSTNCSSFLLVILLCFIFNRFVSQTERMKTNAFWKSRALHRAGAQ